ncbi:MAG: ATP-binding protein, partial [Polyangiaceae bacterium]
ARDAMPDGGRLTIEARLAESRELRERGLVEDRDHIVFTVTDDGNGMDAETQARIFEPFFTTKNGKGFGLGLATARQLLLAHRGHIEIESAPGRGTTFRIYLPGTGGAPVHTTNNGIPILLEHREAWRILLVDDDPSFGKATVRLLRKVGHELELVMSGSEALAAVDAFAPEVLLLDLDLPDRSGEEVLARLAQRRPSTRVVVMSGHAGGSRTEKLRVDYPTLPIVCKPASVAEIEAAIVAAQPVGTIRISDKPEQTIVRTRPSRDTK